MAESQDEMRFILDEFSDDTWFRVAVLTDMELVFAVLKKNRRETVLPALEAGEDPLQTLKASASLGQAPTAIPLENVESLAWHADDETLSIGYVDREKGKSRSASLNFSSSEARAQFVEEIREGFETSDERIESASIWHVGMTQLVVSAFAMVICGGIAIAGYIDPKPVDMNKMRGGRKQALAALYNAVGPTGMLVIGIGITVAMMLWWYVASRNPPMRTTVKKI